MDTIDSFEVISGTYEQFLVGYSFFPKASKLTQTFAVHDHTASIRCLAHCGPYVASGGTDDRIFVYNMKTRKQQCSLTHHNSMVTCLQFTPDHSHLISGSADGVLSIVRVGNWQLEKTWEKGHKGAAILDIAVHSSEKFALTLGADCSLSTWNLIKGRQAFVINLNSKSKDPRNLQKIVWAPDGVRFVLYGGNYTEVWSIQTGGALKQIEHKEKVICCIWKSDLTLVVGHENGDISLVNTDNESRAIHKAHASRVKSLSMYKKMLISICSSGEIKVWNRDFDVIAKYDTGCRLTCLSVVPSIQPKEEEFDKEIRVLNLFVDPETTKKIVSKAKVIEIIEDSDGNEYAATETKSKKKKRQSDRGGNKKQKKNKIELDN